MWFRCRHVSTTSRRAAYVAAAALAVVGCAIAGQIAQASTQLSRTVTYVSVGCSPTANEAFLYNLAKFSSKYGIAPTCETVATYPLSLEGVAQGSLDVAITGVPQVATIASSHLNNIKVVGGYEVAAQGLIFKNGFNPTSWSQLSGKNICGPGATGVGEMLRIAIAQKDVKNVTLTETGYSPASNLQALKDGQCDALAMWSPVLDTAVADGYGHYSKQVDLNTATTIGPGNAVLIAGKYMLNNRPLLVDFLKAYVQSMDYTRAHPTVWASLGAQLSGSSLRVVKESLAHGDISYDIDVKGAEAAARYGVEFGYATSDTSAIIRKYIDASYLAAATGLPVSAITKPLVFPCGKQVGSKPSCVAGKK